MALSKLFITYFLVLSLVACFKKEKPKKLDGTKYLSEKTGIEMIVIDEAGKIAMTNATRSLRRFSGSSYINDPIQSTIKQDFPKTKTVELPGISFLVDNNKAIELVETLNKKFAYRKCIAFISGDSFRDDKKQTISIINATDKFNALRLQETSGGSYIFSTDSLISKLTGFEQKHPFTFIGVGEDWLLIKLKGKVNDWTDLAQEVLKVCPHEETTVEDFAKALQNDNGKISMWWD